MKGQVSFEVMLNFLVFLGIILVLSLALNNIRERAEQNSVRQQEILLLEENARLLDKVEVLGRYKYVSLTSGFTMKEHTLEAESKAKTKTICCSGDDVEPV